MSIGHHKEIWKLTFQALALCWPEQISTQLIKPNYLAQGKQPFRTACQKGNLEFDFLALVQ